MKTNEVKLWINYHRSLFPDWKYSDGSKEANAIAFNSYARSLKPIELSAAKEASDRMLSGEIKKPFRDEDHLAAILSGSRRESRRKIVDGQVTVACPLCNDTGFVECWRRNLIDKMTVACSCHAGDGVVKRWKGYAGCNDPDLLARQSGEVQRYNERFCYRVGDTSEYWANIRRNIEQDKANGIFKTLDELEAANAH